LEESKIENLGNIKLISKKKKTSSSFGQRGSSRRDDKVLKDLNQEEGEFAQLVG
jgi:hypothetical protein